MAKIADEKFEVLTGHIESMRSRIDSIANHGVTWRPSSWVSACPDSSRPIIEELASISEERGVGSPWITRGDVASFGSTPERLFLASMIWGYGTSGLGPGRVARIYSSNPDLLVNIERIGAAGIESPSAAWEAITSTSRSKGLGVAFGTKVAYFAARRNFGEGAQTLICDQFTSWGIWDVAGIKRAVEVGDSYRKYVDECSSIAGDIFTPEEVEYALFCHGKVVLADQRRKLRATK